MTSSRWSDGRINRTSWRKQRARVLVRDRHLCRLQLPGCTTHADTVDHLVPWMPGQIVTDDQLVAACAHCNQSAGSPEKRSPAVDRPAWLA